MEHLTEMSVKNACERLYRLGNMSSGIARLLSSINDEVVLSHSDASGVGEVIRLIALEIKRVESFLEHGNESLDEDGFLENVKI